MSAKEAAIPLPDFAGKAVLDVGCDMGYWSFLAAERGAERVVGIDRNRPVHGEFTDLIARNRLEARRRSLPCSFAKMNLGVQWHECGRFDVVLLFSLYHHVFANCADHGAIWFWLWRQLKPDGVLLWENPVDCADAVVQMNVPEDLQPFYTERLIMAAAARYFRMEHVGPALHEPHRQVYRCTPWEPWEVTLRATRTGGGSGGATKAFLYDNGRRMDEIEAILGVRPIPGSLNLHADGFDWESGYYRSRMLDVASRRVGLDGEWTPRWARFYPLTMNGVPCHAFRFEGERYAGNFVELIAPVRLTDHIEQEVVLCR